MPAKETDASAAPIERNSVSDQVYVRIKAEILSGKLAQGMRVNESHLAKRFVTSRAPVREAVQRLLQEGLLETRAHYGPSVIELDHAKIVQLYEARMAIETRAVAILCENGSDEEFDELDGIVTRMSRAAESENSEALVEAELDFHRLLCELSGNDYLVKINDFLQGQVRLALIIDNSNYLDMQQIVEEHRAFLKVMRTRDTDGVVRALESHIMTSLDNFPERRRG